MSNGKFSASIANDLIAKGSGKTRMNCVFNIALERLGLKPDLNTPAMQHGIKNEADALNIASTIFDITKNDDGAGNQIFFDINDYIGATPDAFGDGFTLDTKCQYYIHTYIEQRDKIVRRYYVQLQVQMLALKVDKGIIFNYLTKPEKWGCDDWEEYPFELHERFNYKEITQDDEVQDDILLAAETWFPYIGLAEEMMKKSKEIDEIEFFYSQLISNVRYVKLKDINWINNEKEVLKFNNEFYIIK